MQKLHAVEAEIEQRTSALSAAAGAYQTYLKERTTWEAQLARMEGNDERPAPSSLKGLIEQLRTSSASSPKF